MSTKKTISRAQNLLTGHYFRMSRAGCERRLNESGEVRGVALQPSAQTGVLMRASMRGMYLTEGLEY